MNILAKLENMPLTYTPRDGWELIDELTGEIFPVETEHAGIMLRNIAIRHDDLIWKFSAVRSNHPNSWDVDIAFRCACCDAPLNPIEPEDICMDCVDIGCNVKDENIVSSTDLA